MDPTGHERSSSNPKKARRTLDESVIVIEDTCDGIDISNNTAVNVQNSSSDPENRKSKSSGARKTRGRKSHGTPHVVGDTRGGTSFDFADGHQASQRDDAGHCVRATGPRRSTNNTGPPGRDATGADLGSVASASAVHCSEQDSRVRDAGVGVQSALARHRDGPSRRPESSDGTDPGPPRAKRARVSVSTSDRVNSMLKALTPFTFISFCLGQSQLLSLTPYLKALCVRACVRVCFE